uniref:Putative secreted protein n=1 Tax=Anopheles marajoara TaxID=58244 RepID=A0A2M4CF15_9DIPT
MVPLLLLLLLATYDVDGVVNGGGGGGGAGRFNAVPCIRLAVTATEQLFIATFVRLDRSEAERQRMAYG